MDNTFLDTFPFKVQHISFQYMEINNFLSISLSFLPDLSLSHTITLTLLSDLPAFVLLGDFIMEYVGEIVSQAEGERRGRISDKRNRSYLFKINEDRWSIHNNTFRLADFTYSKSMKE